MQRARPKLLGVAPFVLTVNLSFGALIYTVSAIVLIFGLWIYYDVRDRKLIDAKRRRVVFHCIRCDKLYSAPEGTEVCKCPRCGFENSRLRF